MSDATRLAEGQLSPTDFVAKETAALVTLVKANPIFKGMLGMLVAVYEPYLESKLGSNVLAAALTHTILTGVEAGLTAS